MMTLLNHVKELVNPYLRDEMLEEGINEISIDEGNIAIDVICDHRVDYELNGVIHAIIEPKRVLMSLSNEDGDYSEPVDITREFSDYEYRLYN